MANTIPDFVTSFKPTIGVLMSYNFLDDPQTNDVLLPTASQVQGTGNMWSPVSGGRAITSAEASLFIADGMGVLLTNVELLALAVANQSETNQVIAGLVLGEPTDNPRTYFCIEFEYWAYSKDGDYESIYPQVNYTKRVYETLPDQSSILRERVVLSSGRIRINLLGPWSDEQKSNKILFYFKNANVDGVELYTVGIYDINNASTGIGFGDTVVWAFRRSWWESAQGMDTDSEPKKELEPSPAFGEQSGVGGYGLTDSDGETIIGNFDDTSDTIGLEAKPSVGVTTAGFINVYKITQNQLSSLGEKLFPHFLPAEILADPAQLTTPETLVMIMKMVFGAMISPVGSSIEIADNLGLIDILMNGKLIDYVLDCHIIPTSISGATVEGLRIGYRQFNDIQLAKANEDYVDVDCGSLSISDYWGNFLDFSSSLELFLPFVGFVPIEPEYIIGGTLSVKYRFNIVDGSFQAKLFATSGKSKLTSSLIGQYGGVACVHLPITGMQYSNVIAGLVNGTTGAVANVMGGNTAGAVTNAMNMAMLRPDAPSSNGYNASSSFLSHRTPYLVIKRPKAQFSAMYNKEKGLPLNVMKQLSTVKGFTIIENPVLHINCNDKEYDELITLLKNGIIL